MKRNSIGLEWFVCSLFVAPVLGIPPAAPDLVLLEGRLTYDGTLCLEIANVGNGSASGTGGPHFVSVFVDHWEAAKIALPTFVYSPGASLEIETGIRLHGTHRRVLVVIDSGHTVSEWNEHNNTWSIDFASPPLDANNVFTPRNGFDLYLGAGVERVGGVDQLYFTLRNVGTQATPANLPVTFSVFPTSGATPQPVTVMVPAMNPTGGWVPTCSTVDCSGGGCSPGNCITKLGDIFVRPSTPIVLTLPQTVRVTADSGLADLDSVNNVFETRMRYIRRVDVDPSNPGTPYGAVLNANNGKVKALLRWPPQKIDTAPPAFERVGFDLWPETGEYGAYPWPNGGTMPSPTKARLLDLILASELGWEFPMKDPLGEGYLSPQRAVDLYLAHVAHSLWFEVRGPELFGVDPLKWSLALIDPSDLAYLTLDPDALLVFGASGGTASFSFQGAWRKQPSEARPSGGIATNLTPLSPRPMFNFMKHLGMIGATQELTVYALSDWWRTNVRHGASDLGDYDEPFLDWGYAGKFPVDKLYYPSSLRWENLAEHISIHGCQTTSGLLQGTLTTVNIPVRGDLSFLDNSTHPAFAHNRVQLPTVRKPCGGTNEPACCPEPPCCYDPPCAETPGILLFHGDDLLRGGTSMDTWIETADANVNLPHYVPSWQIWYSFEEAEKWLDGSVVNPLPIDCVGTPLTCNDSAGEQRTYNRVRRNTLIGRDYEPALWVKRRACELSGNCDIYCEGYQSGACRSLDEYMDDSDGLFVKPILSDPPLNDEQAAMRAHLSETLSNIYGNVSSAVAWLNARATASGATLFNRDIVANGGPTAVASATPSSVPSGGCVVLDGRASFDTSPGPSLLLTYLWTSNSNPPIVLNLVDDLDHPGAIATASMPMTPGSYSFTLTVFDGANMHNTTTAINVTSLGGGLPLTVTNIGSRYLNINVSGDQEVALRVTSPRYPNMCRYIQADGTLGSAHVSRTPAEWCAVDLFRLTGAEIVPSTKDAYGVITTTSYDVALSYSDGSFSQPVSATMWIWGDVDGNQLVDAGDITQTMNASSGLTVPGSIYRYDLTRSGAGCLADGAVTPLDVVAVLDAYSGSGFPCGPPPASTCTECSTNAYCADAWSCTVDTCIAGVCMHSPNNSLCSNDGVFCNGPEVCNTALGCISSGNPCSGGQVCDESSDLCNTPGCTTNAECADPWTCTVDTCNAGVCAHSPDDSLCISDLVFCNGPEVCSATLGCIHSGNPCADGQVCREARDDCGGGGGN